VAVYIFRMRDGKLVEQWDVMQDRVARRPLRFAPLGAQLWETSGRAEAALSALVQAFPDG
jgi:hypothetical protein